MFTLYRNKTPVLNGRYWEDLVDFVEELKKLNPKFIDRRVFIVKSYDQIMYSWNRK